MRGLTLVVAAGSDATRLRTALGLAATHAAIGGRTRLFLDGEAVDLIARPDAADDARYAAAGLPSIAELVASCLDLGVAVQLCQSGLALLDRAAGRDPRLDVGGLTTMMATLGEDRLVVV